MAWDAGVSGSTQRVSCISDDAPDHRPGIGITKAARSTTRRMSTGGSPATACLARFLRRRIVFGLFFRRSNHFIYRCTCGPSPRICDDGRTPLVSGAPTQGDEMQPCRYRHVHCCSSRVRRVHFPASRHSRRTLSTCSQIWVNPSAREFVSFRSQRLATKLAGKTRTFPRSGRARKPRSVK
jgi:hypothetical protein